MIFNSIMQTNASLFVANLSATILSIIGSVWMSYSCLKAPSPRNDTLNLILLIALSDVLYAFANLISNTSLEDNEIICNIEGFLRQCFLTMSVLLAASMALLCYKKSRESFQENLLLQGRQRSNFALYCILVSGFICLVLSAIPLIFTDWVVYRKMNILCYLDPARDDSSEAERVWIMLIFEGIPLLAGCIFTFAVYYLALKKAEQSLGLLLKANGFNDYKLLWYPTLLFCVYVPSFIDNLLTISNKNPALWIQILHVMITHSIGFFNAIFYAVQAKSLARQNRDEEAYYQNGVN